MTFRKKLQYFLVKRLNISNKEALLLILAGKIMIDGQGVFENVMISSENLIMFENQVLQQGREHLYLAFYKPRGIETTLNPTIAGNLKGILPIDADLFPVGRLDKESEGLLILTNDGSIFDKTLRSENKTEKEYRVTVDKKINNDFIFSMSTGVNILGKTTLPCQITQIDDFTFNIILIQGINRQIRRMCYKLGYEVLRLIRIRIGEICLGTLQGSEFRYFKP